MADENGDRRSIWPYVAGIIGAVAALITAVAGLFAGGILGNNEPTPSPAPLSSPPHTSPPQTSPPQTSPPQTSPPQTSPPQTSPPQTSPPATKTITVNMTADPQQVPPGASTWIRVEVLSGPDSPIADADVTIHVGGGSFTATGGLDVEGKTNSAGFFAAQWESPASAPAGQNYGYFITAAVTKVGYEPTTKRIRVSIE